VWFLSDAGVRPVLNADFNTELSWDIPLTDGYKSAFLSTVPLPAHSNLVLAIKSVWHIARAVLRRRFDLVWVHGYSSPANLVAAICGRLSGVPILIRDDATLVDRRSKSKQLLKRLMLPMVFRGAYGLFIGTANKRFLLRHGVREENMFFAPYAVDNQFFSAQAAYLRPQRNDLREAFGFAPDTPLILFCGKLILKKDPLTLLRAFEIIRRDFACGLLFAGDGPLRNEILDVVRRLEVPDVHISGFLNQSEVGKAYAAAEVIVLPSKERETWGLVINEAMNFGLPVIVSDKVGCSEDLVRHGENGYVFVTGSIQELVRCLRDLLSDEARRRLFGRCSARIVDSWSVEKSAASLCNAFRSVMAREGVAR
jgi:glycosyltransferase involved in cell wall biosynthesis